MTTTLPLKLESCVVLPEESEMVNSGDLRCAVTDGRANADVIIATITIANMPLYVFIACASLGLFFLVFQFALQVL
jgi:hypothetical protein